jgi:hypothetical protein
MTDLGYKVRLVVKGDCESDLEAIGDVFKVLSGCDLYSLNSNTNAKGDIVFTLRFTIECADADEANRRFDECVKACKDENAKVTMETIFKS